MLHTAFTLSPLAHARIITVDAGAARAHPGVHAVLTGEDLPRLGGGAIKDMPFLARGRVRYMGRAGRGGWRRETQAIAEAAALLVDVGYEELPAVLTIEDALAPGAPLVHEDIGAYELSHPVEHSGNVLSRQEIVEGDVDAAWAECDVIVENAFSTGAQYHHALEPTGAVASFDPTGKVTGVVDDPVGIPCPGGGRTAARYADVEDVGPSRPASGGLSAARAVRISSRSRSSSRAGPGGR